MEEAEKPDDSEKIEQKESEKEKDDTQKDE